MPSHQQRNQVIGVETGREQPGVIQYMATLIVKGRQRTEGTYMPGHMRRSRGDGQHAGSGRTPTEPESSKTTRVIVSTYTH